MGPLASRVDQTKRPRRPTFADSPIDLPVQNYFLARTLKFAVKRSSLLLITNCKQAPRTLNAGTTVQPNSHLKIAGLANEARQTFAVRMKPIMLFPSGAISTREKSESKCRNAPGRKRQYSDSESRGKTAG